MSTDDSGRIIASIIICFMILGLPLLLFTTLILAYGSFTRFIQFLEGGKLVDIIFAIFLGGTCLALSLAIRAIVRWIRK